MKDVIGQQLGNYRIVKQLGHGGFADVYLAEHVYLNTQTAIKILHTQLVQEEIEKFRNEALLIAHLVHPHIVRVLDFDVEDGTPYLVMDYAPNGTLRQRAPKGTRLSPTVFLPYVQQVAEALQYAHDQKVIHRDIKPENMLLDHNDVVKLSDFGIALAAQSSRSQETESSVIGTMLYMSPEQIQGKARPASDQYSLAVVVYEWLTGEKPFKGSYIEVVTQHLTAPPPPIDEQSLSVPHAVTQVLWQALAKDPHERFARVQDFADALERAYRTREPIPVRREPAPPYGSQPYAPDFERPALFTPPAPRNYQETMQASPAAQATPYLSGGRMASALTGARPVVKGATGCAQSLVKTLVVLSLLVCVLGFAGYSFFTNRNPSSQAASLSNDFMTAIANHNYEQAYNDLGPSITAGTSHDGFIKQAQSEDRCYGPVKNYQETGTSSPNGQQVHNYTITRTSLAHPYHLHVTVGKDFFGNWHITDYNSDVEQEAGRPTCS